MKATVLFFAATFSGLALATNDHSEHNCCYQNKETGWVWTIHPDLTHAACNDWTSASYANSKCTENANVARISGQDFLGACRKHMKEWGLQDPDHVGAGYRGNCN
ncbi:unnamed protein product [Cercospora beticola]|nr:unnamed protein product [Cercospora beticola]